MSPNIWTRCAGGSSQRAYQGDAWRVVESQQLVGTRKLVDSEDERELLEQLIDDAKPPPPRGPEFKGVHYLLATSFRYPPLRYGSRFGTRADPGIWYGAEHIRTALAEVGYYRMVFLDGCDGDLGPLMVELTAFRARLRTDRAVDLTEPPFDAFTASISSKTRYDASQRLGRDMRDAGVVLFRYRSARDLDGGANIGLFSPGAFARKQPFDFKHWYCVVDRKRAEFSRKDFVESGRFAFARAQYAVDGVLPSPAV